MSAEGDAVELAAHLAQIEARNRSRNRTNAQAKWLENFQRGYIGPPINPAFVWMAIRYCAVKNIEFPPWVFEYLTTSAARVVALIDLPKESDSKSVVVALGFTAAKGKNSAFSAAKRARAREPACVEFAMRLLSGERVEDALRGAAAVGAIGVDAMKLWLNDFFPSRRDGEKWKPFLTDLTDPLSNRYSPLLTALCARGYLNPAFK